MIRRGGPKVVCSTLTIGLLSVWHTGCWAPLRPYPDRTTKQTRAQTNRNRASADHDPSGTSSFHRLTVNGDTVEAHELWRGLHNELAAQSETLTSEGYNAFVAQRAAQLIRDKVAEMLLHQRAKLRLSPEIEKRVHSYVDAEIRKIVTAQYGGRQRRYEKHLESQSQTLQDVREKLRREIIIASFLEQEVKPKVAEPTRAELLAAYRASADSYRRTCRRRMSMIDVHARDRLPNGVDGTTPIPPETARAEALSRARAAQAELQDGLDFADVARRYSDGLHAVEGGAWGWVTKDSVRERFQPAVDALYQLEVEEVSRIIEMADGFCLVRCDEVDPGFEPDFQSLQPQLKERYFRAAYNRLIAELVAELQEKARIEPADLEQFHAAVVEAAFDQQTVARR